MIESTQSNNTIPACFNYLFELNFDSTSIYITRPSKPPQFAGNEASNESFKQNCNIKSTHHDKWLMKTFSNQ
jgi:hypothetical protein